MAVSCLSQAADPNGEGHLLPTLQPTGLVEPLHWLTQTLQKQDQDRLEQLWNLVPQDLVLLQRCVSTFTRRYPNAEASGQFRLRLARQRRRQRLRRVAVGLGLFLALVLSLWGYDAWANHQVEQFARTHSTDPEAVLEQWTSFERWHPTRHLWLARSLAAEADFRHDMEQQCRAARCERQLAELRRDMRDADANLTQVWERLQRVRDDFPEHKIDDELVAYSATVKSRLLEQRERLAEEAYQRLLQRESQDDNQTRVRSAEQFLTEHANTSHVPAIRHRLEGYLRAEEERAMLAVRRYSAENPFHFYSRQEQYRAYLQRFPTGQYASEARSAVAAIETDWDRYDFRKIRDHLQEKPGELKVLDQLSRAYLAAHAQGKYVSVTHDLLRWSERVASEGSYKVTLRSGSFDPKTNGYLSRGLNLSVELEVNGVHYGPSTIARRTAEPEWDYTFPRPIRWKLGDTVKIRVTDHYYWKRTILEVNSEDDPLGMRLLSGEVVRGKHAMKFESDFDMPVLPRLE
jgi:hypothetical protein